MRTLATVAIILVSGCASSSESVVPPSPPAPEIAREPDALQLYQASLARYAKRPYRDEGTCRVKHVMADRVDEEVFSFRTDAPVDGGFYFEYRTYGHEEADFWIRTSPDGRTESWWRVRPKVQQEPSLSFGLARQAGVSKLMTVLVPMLLVRDAPEGAHRPLLNLTNLKFRRVTTIEDEECDTISGVSNARDEFEVSIGRRSGLIRRVATQHMFPTFRSEKVVTYTTVH